MRVYEAIVKGLESVGVEAAFGGAGENAAGLMLALKHSEHDPAGHHPPRAGRVVHGLRLRDVHRQARVLLRHRGTGRVQPVLRPRRGDVGLLPGARGLRLRVDGVEGPRARSTRPPACNRTPDSHDDVRRRRPRSRSCSPTSTTPATCSRRRSTSRSRAGPGRCTSTCPRTSPTAASRCDELPRHPARRARRSSPDPARVEAVAEVLADAIAARQEGRRARRLRRDPQRRRGRGQAAHRALPDPAADHAGRQGHRRPRATRCASACSATAATRAPGRRSARPTSCSRVGNALQPARHVQLPRRPVRRQDADPRQHLRDRDRQGLQGRPRDRLRRPPRRWPRCTTRSSRRSARSRRSTVDGQDYETRRIPHLTDSIHPGQLAQAIGRMLPPRAILLADAGAHLALARLLRRARGGSELPQGRRRSARWPDTSTAPRREGRPPRPHRGRRLRRRLLQPRPASS